jgi:hypothetical protein
LKLGGELAVIVRGQSRQGGESARCHGSEQLQWADQPRWLASSVRLRLRSLVRPDVREATAVSREGTRAVRPPRMLARLTQAQTVRLLDVPRRLAPVVSQTGSLDGGPGRSCGPRGPCAFSPHRGWWRRARAPSRVWTGACTTSMSTATARGHRLRVVAPGARAWLFVGSDDHAEAAANLLSLIAACQLHRLHPEAW